MGDWGSFQVTVSNEGAETEEACTIDLVKSVNIRFRPGITMKEALSKATFTARQGCLVLASVVIN